MCFTWTYIHLLKNDEVDDKIFHLFFFYFICNVTPYDTQMRTFPSFVYFFFTICSCLFYYTKLQKSAKIVSMFAFKIRIHGIMQKRCRKYKKSIYFWIIYIVQDFKYALWEFCVISKRLYAYTLCRLTKSHKYFILLIVVQLTIEFFSCKYYALREIKRVDISFSKNLISLAVLSIIVECRCIQYTDDISQFCMRQRVKTTLFATKFDLISRFRL